MGGPRVGGGRPRVGGESGHSRHGSSQEGADEEEAEEEGEGEEEEEGEEGEEGEEEEEAAAAADHCDVTAVVRGITRGGTRPIKVATTWSRSVEGGWGWGEEEEVKRGNKK
jgi:hypothetical protein